MPESLTSRATVLYYAAMRQGARHVAAKARRLIAAVTALAALPFQAALDRRVAGVPGTGIVVGVIDHGVQKIYVAGSAGNGQPVDEHTLFEIGSVSKTFTATALAAMAMQGTVHLNDPISQYLPSGVKAPVKDGETITLLELAEQRSGLPRLPSNMQGAGGDDPYADYSLADMYAFLNGYQLTRDPGAAYEYSNYGVALLGQLLANRARSTYPALLEKTVLAPLGMSETTFAIAGTPDPAALATGHDLGGTAVPTWHAQSILPAGGILSSIGDMLKFLQCNMGSGPLAAACLFAQQPRAAGEPGHQIGLVWNRNSTTGTLSHDGATNGFLAFIAVSADRQTGVVALSNGPVVADIAAHVIDASYPIAACPTSVDRGKTNPTSYAGVYCNASSGVTLTVAAAQSSDQLSIALVPQPALLYDRIDPDSYYSAAVGATFKFARVGRDVVGLRLMQFGETIPALRLNGQGDPVVAQLPSQFPPEISLDRSVLAQYVGKYVAIGGTFTIALVGNSLYVQLTGQPAFALYASAADHFFLKVVDAQIRFHRNESGAIDSLILHQNGNDIYAVRSP
jgi:serine-type D-Ala-D-Ala carboxypeptidase/endopeptidase